MATKAKPFHNIDKYEKAKAKWDNLKVAKYKKPKIRGFVCRKAPLHGVDCQEGGYTNKNGFKRHVLDQHRRKSYRRYNSIVCSYRGLQHRDLRGHMERDHPHYVDLRRERPQVWDRFYNKLLKEQRRLKDGVFTVKSKNCWEVDKPFPTEDDGEESEDDGEESEDDGEESEDDGEESEDDDEESEDDDEESEDDDEVMWTKAKRQRTMAKR